MTRRPITRTLLLLMRDALGRFTRIRVGADAARPVVRRRRPVMVPAVQLALF